MGWIGAQPSEKKAAQDSADETMAKSVDEHIHQQNTKGIKTTLPAPTIALRTQSRTRGT
jgi:hypothetical protein